MKLLIAFIAIALISQSGVAQNKIRTQLTGKITDAKTGEPLAGASVSLEDSKLGTTSNAQGLYSINNLPPGHTIVEVSYAGYETVVNHIDITVQNELNVQLRPSIREYEGVTVTGVAGATSIRKAPIPITRVNKTELLTTPSTNIIDALSRQPGVTQLTTGPAVSKPVIRGLGYNRLITINDGVRQEGQQWGDEHGIEIDENSVSRVEILKGPASLIYGSDAIAGVINIITTSPVEDNTVSGNVLADYQTNNNQRSFFANVGGNNHGFNWNAWGDYTKADDYKNRYDGKVFNSAFDSKNAGGYVGYNGAWGFSHLIVSTFNQQTGVVEGERKDDGTFVQSDPLQHVQHNKIISDNSFSVGAGKVKLNVAWQNNRRKEFESAAAGANPNLYFDLQTINYSASYQFHDKDGWITTIGVNGMGQQNENRAEEKLIPEYNLLDVGTFVYSQLTIKNATVSGGIRYDNRHLQSKQLLDGNETKFEGFTTNFSNISGSLGVSYSPVNSFNLKLNLARGFRAPSIPELATNGAHEGTNRYEYGDNKLKSETTLQADFDIEYSSEHVLMSVSAFYNHISNFIFYSRLSGADGADSLVAVDGDMIPAYKFSQHNANMPGFEASIDFHPHPLDWLHWENNFSYVRGKFTAPIGESENVPFVPAARLSSEVRAALFTNAKTFKKTTFTFEAANYFRQRHPFTSFGTESETPAYLLLNAGFSTSVYDGDKKLLTLFLSGNNLADVGYQNHLSRLKYTDVNDVTGRQGVYNMGRNFMLKVYVPIGIK